VKIIRGFEQGSRYKYDFDKCTIAKGWAQIDTPNDTEYFGNWINPFDLKVFSYVEGDVIEVIADNKEELYSIINDMVKTYDGLTIDPGENVELKNKLISSGLMNYLR
jgi:hypothetical protein